MPLLTPTFILSLALLDTGGLVAVDNANAATDLKYLIVLTDFDELDEASKRRLDYYASQILAEIGEMTTLEQAGDAAAVERTLNHARQLALRMAAASDDYGLSRAEMLDFFVSKLGTNMTGPLPNAILSDDGQLMIFSLFEDTGEPDGGDAGESDYIDLLRTQDLDG